MDALVYEGRGVFVSTESGSKGYYVINLLVAMPHDPTNTGRGYAATQRCGLVGIRPTDGVTEFRDGREIARIFVD